MTANPATEPVAVRYVDDVDTLRLLSDPTRLAIVQLLMEGAAKEPRIRTVKELAHELREPQTKLYRHIKQLQTAGLIQVADTRLVSGIVESRYRTGQLSLRIAEEFLAGRAPVDDTVRVLGAMLDRHRTDLFNAIRAGHVHVDSSAAGTAPVQPTLAFLSATIPADRAASFASRLAGLVAEFVALDSDPEGLPVNLLVAYYATVDLAAEAVVAVPKAEVVAPAVSPPSMTSS